MSSASPIKGTDSSDNNELDIRRWAITIAVIVVVLLCVLLVFYLIHLWSDKSVWKVLDVLALPITLGAAVPLLNWLQKRHELEIIDATEGARRKREQDVEDQRAQDEALQTYLDQIGKLLLDKDILEEDKLSWQPGDEVVRKLARARTLTVLRRLDSGRKRSVVDFLYEANLIKRAFPPPPSLPVPPPVIELGSPDSHYGAADLSGADLRGAILTRAAVGGDLDHKGANLSEADLRDADLSFAYLRNANLNGADLSGADLSDARGVTEEQLEDQAQTLEGAIMPDGSKHP
jgi:hypothetical protein